MEVYNEAPFSMESNTGEILKSPLSDSFLELYQEWYDISIDDNSSDSEKEEVLHLITVYKGVYLFKSILPISKYLTAVLVKFFPSELVEQVMEKAKEFGYICPINEVYDTLVKNPLNVSRLVLSSVDNINLMVAFENSDKNAFLTALGETKVNVKDLLLFCGYLSKFKPFPDTDSSEYSIIKPELALADIDNPFPDTDSSEYSIVKQKLALNDIDNPFPDTLYDFQNHPELFSVDFVKEFVGSTLLRIVKCHSLIPSEDMSAIDTLLESNIYKDELIPIFMEFAQKSENIDTDNENYNNKDYPPHLRLYGRLREERLQNVVCELLLNKWFKNGSDDEPYIKYVFFGKGSNPINKKLIYIGNNKVDLIKFVMFLCKGSVPDDVWVYFNQYISDQNGNKVFASNPASNIKSKDKEGKYVEEKTYLFYEERLRNEIINFVRPEELTKREQEDLK